MTPATIKALKGSIAKWEAIVAGTGVDERAFNCPLCWVFMDSYCANCPVSNKTGMEGCVGSPYHDFLDAPDLAVQRAKDRVPKSKPNGPISQAAAEAEVAFLKSLLPEGEE